MDQWRIAFESVVAGLFASLACGLGALRVAFNPGALRARIGLGYALAALMVWLLAPLVLPMLGFAAGAMIVLVVVELIPAALEDRNPTEIAWAFVLGFSLMVLVQVVL